VARAVCGTVDRAVSGLNVVDCVGNVWEWLDTLSVNWLDTGEVGQGIDWIDAMPGQGVGQVQILDEEALVSMQAGGYYFAGVRCGSRSVNMLHPPWYGEAKHGCRFCCDAL
jgi:formylglycine-generating enzyme required for sulfatase activity